MGTEGVKKTKEKSKKDKKNTKKLNGDKESKKTMNKGVDNGSGTEERNGHLGEGDGPECGKGFENSGIPEGKNRTSKAPDELQNATDDSAVGLDRNVMTGKAFESTEKEERKKRKRKKDKSIEQDIFEKKDPQGERVEAVDKEEKRNKKRKRDASIVSEGDMQGNDVTKDERKRKKKNKKGKGEGSGAGTTMDLELDLNDGTKGKKGKAKSDDVGSEDPRPKKSKNRGSFSSKDKVFQSEENLVQGNDFTSQSDFVTKDEKKRKKKNKKGKGESGASAGTTMDLELDLNEETKGKKIPESQKYRRRKGRNGLTRLSCVDEDPSGNENVNGVKTSKKTALPEQSAIPDTPLLRNLGKHPSVHARSGRVTLAQNLNFRGAWPTAVTLYRQAHDDYKKLLDAAGFGDFMKIDAVQIPQAYLVALMERWFSETNTLHLPCCEIGPTPVDWTMITGLRFQGKPVCLEQKFEMNRALELLGVERAAVTEGKIRLSSIAPTVEDVKAAPASVEAKEVMFRRLFLYVIGSCFFSNNRSVLNHEFVRYVEYVDEVGSYNWGAMTFAAFLTGMRRKVTGETGAFTGFWPFLLFWAFEYLDVFRPNIAEGDVFPRAMQWSFDKVLVSFDSSDLTASRCQLDCIEETQVTWQPYLGSAVFGSKDMIQTTLLSDKRVPFWSVETWEYYLGERCCRQLGSPCRVPFSPPSKMHGNLNELPEDDIGVGRSTDTLVMEESVDYSSWFSTNSIGKIVDVSQFLGGAETVFRIFSRWLAFHHPEMMLIRCSDYEAMVKDRDTAVAECEMLRAKLAQAEETSSEDSCF